MYKEVTNNTDRFNTKCGLAEQSVDICFVKLIEICTFVPIQIFSIRGILSIYKK